MSNSPSIAAAHTLPVHRSRLALIALWGVQVVLAGMFLLAGGSKLAGAVATHLFIVGGSPAVPVVLLLGSLGIAWARRDQLSWALSRVH